MAIAVGSRGRNDPGDVLESFKFGLESFMFSNPVTSDKVCRRSPGCRTGVPGRMEARDTEGRAYDVTLRDTALGQRRG